MVSPLFSLSAATFQTLADPHPPLRHPNPAPSSRRDHLATRVRFPLGQSSLDPPARHSLLRRLRTLVPPRLGHGSFDDGWPDWVLCCLWRVLR